MIRTWLFAIAILTPLAPIVAQTNPAAQQLQEHAERARQYLNAGKPDLAIREFRAILSINPGNLDARANVGVLEYFAGKYGDAIPDLQSAVQSNPGLWKLQALLGMAEKRTGENAKAQADLASAFPHLSEKKLQIEAGIELIEVDYGVNDLGNAAEIANKLRQVDPDNPDILYAAHRVYSDLSDETLLSLAMVAPHSARMHQIMAHELARQAKDEEAIAQYREAIKLDPKLPDIHYELAEILNTQGSKALRDEAEREFKTALTENPFDERSMCRLGDIAAHNSDLPSALQYYSRALQMQPNDAMANLGLGKVYLSMHQPDKALPLLQNAVRIEPFDAVSHYRLAAAYRELGNSDASRHEVEEFEKLKTMKRNLGDVYQSMRLAPAGKGDAADDSQDSIAAK